MHVLLADVGFDVNDDVFILNTSAFLARIQPCFFCLGAPTDIEDGPRQDQLYDQGKTNCSKDAYDIYDTRTKK